MCESSPKLGEIKICRLLGVAMELSQANHVIYRISVYTCILSKHSNPHFKIALSPRLNGVAGSSGAWILHNPSIGDGFWCFLPSRSSLGVPT